MAWRLVWVCCWVYWLEDGESGTVVSPLKLFNLAMSLHQMYARAVDSVQMRIELLGNEIELEKRRLFDGMLIAAFALVFLGIGLLMACATVVFLCFENYKLQACLTLTLLFLALGTGCVLKARSHLKNPLNLFRTSQLSLNHSGSPSRR